LVGTDIQILLATGVDISIGREARTDEEREPWIRATLAV
jgi:hypothetical protein